MRISSSLPPYAPLRDPSSADVPAVDLLQGPSSFAQLTAIRIGASPWLTRAEKNSLMRLTAMVERYAGGDTDAMEKVAALVNLMEMTARSQKNEVDDAQTSLKKLRKEMDALTEKDPDVSLAPSLMVEQTSLELRGMPTRALQEEQEQLPA